MRQYGSVPPWLAASNTPAVKSTSGLGTSGGAAVQTPDSGGFGDVNVYVGAGAGGGSWSIVLAFPSTPPTLFIAGDSVFGPITQSTSGDNVTLSGTFSSSPGPQHGVTKPYTIHYEWAVSQ